MGGTKKKSTSQQKKSTADSSKKEGKKGKKGDKEKSEGSNKAEISVTLTDEQASKVIQGSKVITVQELARQTGVKISAANAYLKKSLENGTVKKVGGYSGHHIYRPSST